MVLSVNSGMRCRRTEYVTADDQTLMKKCVEYSVALILLTPLEVQIFPAITLLPFNQED